MELGAEECHSLASLAIRAGLVLCAVTYRSGDRLLSGASQTSLYKWSVYLQYLPCRNGVLLCLSLFCCCISQAVLPVDAVFYFH